MICVFRKENNLVYILYALLTKVFQKARHFYDQRSPKQMYSEIKLGKRGFNSLDSRTLSKKKKDYLVAVGQLEKTAGIIQVICPTPLKRLF